MDPVTLAIAKNDAATRYVGKGALAMLTVTRTRNLPVRLRAIFPGQ